MMVLDNHVSMPQWCCGESDENGFFEDKFLIQKNRYMVVGMSMRNELRGPRQNKDDWYRYIRLGGKTIHRLNPKLLVIISGLGYDTNLSFLRNETLSINFDNKLVYEDHWYAFTDGRRKDWEFKTPDQKCANVIKEFDDKLEFLTSGKNPIPLFLSEFGVDQLGLNDWDNRFLSCFLAYAAEKDLDWAIWAMHGSYYIKNRIANFDETYCVLDKNWNHPRNPNFRFQRDIHWSYAGNQTPIKLMGTSKCLKPVGNALPVTVLNDCLSVWKVISDSIIRLAAMDTKGRSFCLDYNPSKYPLVLSNECLCVSNDESSKCKENPETQWFKLMQTNVE
ncbi:hypothetical protein MKX01_005079 [Papaver californicum]|nr:hypothetical protein MKX01_005079 [Papaver californicum]